MASAIDSGVDTGNDSNDSSVQEKLSKLDIRVDGIFQPQKSVTEISSEEQMQNCQTSNAFMNDESLPTSSTNMSLTHLQPASLMQGYEYQPSASINTDMNRRLSVMFNVITPNGGVFTSGVPLGTEYKQSEIFPKEHRYKRSHKSQGRLKWRIGMVSWQNNSNYTRVRDTLRMCRAACHNNTQAMRELLEAGVSPNCQDRYKRSPLHLAACMGYTDMVKLLLDHGADPNAKDSIGNTPLHLAACTNHVAVITLLLKAGTRVSEKDMAGHSPLQLAITKFNIMKRSIMPHPVLKEQVCQVITMLTEYMRLKESPSVDPELLNKFESLVRVSDSTEEVESNIQDLLSNLNSLSLSGPS